MNPETLTEIPKQEKKDYSEDQFYYEMIGTIDKYWRNFDNLQREKHQFIERYPERAQEVEIFFDFPEYCQIDQEIADRMRWPQGEVQKKYTTLTEFVFLIRNHSIYNVDNQKSQEYFWNKLRMVSANFRDGDSISNRLESCVESETCAYLLAEESGLNPTQTTPEKDAFEKQDLTGYSPTGERIAMQIKTRKKWRKLNIKESNEIVYPTISAGDIRLSSDENDDIAGFRGSLSELRERLKNPKIISLKFEFPGEGYYEKYTGKPTDRCRNEFKEKFKEYQ